MHFPTLAQGHRSVRGRRPASFRSLGVVSPHLDDATLSFARLVGTAERLEIATVFSDGPKRPEELTTWDRLSGCFQPGDDVAAVRRGEDQRACGVLGATAHHLGFWDRQYRNDRFGYEGPADDALERAVTEALRSWAQTAELDALALPLGIGHADHELVREACLSAAGALALPRYAYADLPYAVEDREAAAKALWRFRAVGMRPVPVVTAWPVDTALVRKAAAMRCHRSQRRSLGYRRMARALLGTERLWMLDASATVVASPTSDAPGQRA